MDRSACSTHEREEKCVQEFNENVRKIGDNKRSYT
jgi:hypothetical protein